MNVYASEVVEEMEDTDALEVENQDVLEETEEQLTEEEHAIYKRGRNAKSVSPAKNQSVTDYRRATGFEALLGYLYLKKEWQRILDLVKMGLDSLNVEEN